MLDFEVLLFESDQEFLEVDVISGKIPTVDDLIGVLGFISAIVADITVIVGVVVAAVVVAVVQELLVVQNLCEFGLSVYGIGLRVYLEYLFAAAVWRS